MLGYSLIISHYLQFVYYYVAKIRVIANLLTDDFKPNMWNVR
jgi:hypothetical protein